MDARAGLPVAWACISCTALLCGIWLAGLKPSAYTASASAYGVLALGVARETDAIARCGGAAENSTRGDNTTAVISSSPFLAALLQSFALMLGQNLKVRYALSYLGITSRANLLATTSRSSVRFFPASIMASRDP